MAKKPHHRPQTARSQTADITTTPAPSQSATPTSTSHRKWDWYAFFANFLAVVLGIFLTFAIQSLINERQEEKDVKAALQLVRNELLENVNEMDGIQASIDLEHNASLYLMQYYDNFEACHPDSMKKYCNVPLAVYPIELSDGALELLKSSALFQKIKDLDLSLNILRAYKWLSMEEQNFKYYNQKKEKMLDNAMQEKAKAVFASSHFTPAEMWNAITSTTEGRQFLHEINITTTFGFGHKEYKESIIKVVEAIDQYVGQTE